MSVTTTADERLESARKHTTTALLDITEIVINKCWGHDAWKPEYTEKMNKAFDLLREAQKELDW